MQDVRLARVIFCVRRWGPRIGCELCAPREFRPYAPRYHIVFRPNRVVHSVELDECHSAGVFSFLML